MQILVKVIISLAVILAATAIARRFPSVAGLIGVMPLTGALVLAWVYVENSGDPATMQQFAWGALWGILPSIAFFLVALFCLRKGFSLPLVLIWSFAAWLGSAAIHQWTMR